MRRISLGGAGVSVPVIGQGTMGIGGYFAREDGRDAESVEVIAAALDAGLTFIDTAESYGSGHAEELVGRAIRGRRPDVTIATKFSPQHSVPADLLRSAEASLRRLQTDYIDLYQTHWPDPKTPFEETLEGLGRLVESGKVRHVGLSNTTLRQIQAARGRLGEAFVAVQQQYNLADRFVEQDILPACKRQGLALIAYSPLLEGKVAPDDERRNALLELAAPLGFDAAQLALAWLLRHENVIAIPKATTRRHIAANARAGSIVLPGEVLDAIGRLYEPRVLQIEVRDIDIPDAHQRSAYKTLAEALANAAGMTPSPLELARELSAGEPFRPIKVRPIVGAGKRYALSEGRLRYWAWVIAFEGRRPVPAVEG